MINEWYGSIYERQWKLNDELSLASATIYDTTKINNFLHNKAGPIIKRKRIDTLIKQCQSMDMLEINWFICNLIKEIISHLNEHFF